jgi:hypothetical protein
MYTQKRAKVSYSHKYYVNVYFSTNVA